MEQKIKEIVAGFVKVPAEQIGPATRIDRSAVQSSILLHRMYARLAEAGLVVENYSAVRVFGDLSGASVGNVRENGAGPSESGEGVYLEGAEAGYRGTGARLSGSGEAGGGRSQGSGETGGARFPTSGPAPGIGVDIEEVAALPRTPDFRKDEFYRMNFTAGEIAYCILQSDPYSSFAGLFAAKEAIVKAGGFDRSRSFNGMEIDHTPEGKPQYTDYGISISHAGGMAVAVAVAAGSAASANMPAAGLSLKEGQAANKGTASWISWLALLLSVLALVLVLLH